MPCPDPLAGSQPRTACPGCWKQPRQASRHAVQGGAFSRSGPRCPQNRSAAPSGSRKPVLPDRADRRSACGSRGPCRCRSKLDRDAKWRHRGKGRVQLEECRLSVGCFVNMHDGMGCSCKTIAGVIMVFSKRSMGMAVVAIGLSSAPGLSATLDVVGGQLMGASGVDVGGTLYDVQFVDGSCVALFDGCDAASDFTFTTAADAIAASQALLDVVFIDGVAGLFDTNPNLTNGITGATFAFVSTPYEATLTGVNVYSAANYAPSVGAADAVFFFPISSVTDTTAEPNAVYADWQKSVADVPLPAGGVLLLSALGGIAALRRRKKRTA